MVIPNQQLRQQARERGDAFFLPSTPCHRGHLSKRYVSTSGCVECQGITNADRGRLQPPCIEGHRKRRKSGGCGECQNNKLRKVYDAKKEQNRIDGKREQGVRLAAEARGDKKYFTGRPCGRGHIALRNLQGQCLACKNEDTAAFIKKHRTRYNAHRGKRRARKLQATPKWSDLTAITEIYSNCPLGFHVDHIIPLKNELVSGLHVPANLQYLTESENARKHNKFEPMHIIAA